MDETIDKKICEYCGAEVTADSLFCASCGAKLSEEEFEAAEFTAEENAPAVPSEQPPVAQQVEEKKKKRVIGLGESIIVTVIGMLLVFIIMICLMTVMERRLKKNGFSYSESKHENIKIGDKEVSTGDNITIQIDDSQNVPAAAVYAKCVESVVGVRITAEMSSTPWSQSIVQTVSEGSGVVFREDGYIITNHHVIDGALEKGKIKSGYAIIVYTDKELRNKFEAKLVGYDETTDLALLKIEKKGLKAIEFAETSELNIGEKVFAIGSPGGLEFMNSISEGIVSGVNRNLATDSGFSYSLIQTTTAINPGNSGGALLNGEGKLVGICEMKITGNGFEGMGFAISATTAKDISEELMATGKIEHAQLGITVNTQYTPAEAEESGYPEGAWVNDVTSGSAADKAGLKANMIITKFNGVSISDFYSLRKEITKCKVGQTIELEVYYFNGNKAGKDGQFKTISLTLEAAPGNN